MIRSAKCAESTIWEPPKPRLITHEALIQAGPSGRVPALPEKRFLISSVFLCLRGELLDDVHGLLNRVGCAGLLPVAERRIREVDVLRDHAPGIEGNGLAVDIFHDLPLEHDARYRRVGELVFQ